MIHNNLHSIIKQRTGFSLIEMIVSMALFSVVSTITVGTILVLINNNKNLSAQQNNIGAVTFTLDNITRELRMGNFYNCQDNNFANQNSYGFNTRNCDQNDNGTNNSDGRRNGLGVSFIESSGRLSEQNPNVRVAYYFRDSTLWRRVGNNRPERMLPEGIILDMSRSRFFVTNSALLTLGGRAEQPRITIHISVVDSAGVEQFFLQTTVVQRSLKI